MVKTEHTNNSFLQADRHARLCPPLLIAVQLRLRGALSDYTGIVEWRGLIVGCDGRHGQVPHPGEVADALLSTREEHGQRRKVGLVVLPVVRDYDEVLPLVGWGVEGDEGLAGETVAFEHLEGEGERGEWKGVTSIQVHVGGRLRLQGEGLVYLALMSVLSRCTLVDNCMRPLCDGTWF